MDRKDENLVDWLVRNPPYWAHDVIRDLEQDYPYNDPQDGLGLREFVYLTEFSNSNVDPEKIVGQRDHYSGQSWFDAIIDPKLSLGKMRECLRLADCNPDYYFQDLSGIHLTSYDGQNWYSDNDGNHRAIIGKFLLAMIAVRTGEKHCFPHVSIMRQHIDYTCRSIYLQLNKLINEAQVDIDLNVASVPLPGSVGQSEIRVFVSDNRWGKNLERFGWLSPAEFAKFADWVIACDGVLSKWDKLKNSFGSSDHQKLYYPGMSGEFLQPPGIPYRARRACMP